MSPAQKLFRWPVLALLGILGGFALGLSVRADVLDDFKKNRDLAAQKLEKEVEDALLQVQKIKAKEPAKALGILNTYKHILEGDTFLAKTRRDDLLKVVSQQIQIVEPMLQAKPPAPPAPIIKKNSVDDLYNKYGQYTPSQGKPSSPYDTANKYFKDFNQKINTAKGYEDNKNKAVGQLLNNSLDFGEVPVNGYQSFSKDWKFKKDLRLQLAGLKLSPQEAELLKAMNSVLSLDLDKRTFRQVIDYLGERTGQTIVVDPAAMKELQIDYDTPVSFKANKVTLRTALKKILGDVGLAYILKDGGIQVVTPIVARQTMTTRSYYVADLLPVADLRFGPFFNEAREQYFANQIMQMIVMTVEPQSWAVNGGGGTIFYNPVTKSIVIRNSAELHLSLKSGIGH